MDRQQAATPTLNLPAPRRRPKGSGAAHAKTSIGMPDDVLARLRDDARAKDVSVSWLITEIVRVHYQPEGQDQAVVVAP